MSFPVPDFEPLITVAEFVFGACALIVAFCAGYICGGIVQRG